MCVHVFSHTGFVYAFIDRDWRRDGFNIYVCGARHILAITVIISHHAFKNRFKIIYHIYFDLFIYVRISATGETPS